MRLKGKFKPNLADASSRVRVRRVSGVEASPSKRLRTISGSSSTGGILSPGPTPSEGGNTPHFSLNSPPYTPDLEPELKSPRREVARSVEPQAVFDVLASPPHPVPPQPGLDAQLTPNHDDICFSPGSNSSPMRQRKLTESKEVATTPNPASVFDRRRADHKRKFTKGVPEHNKMTMFDLIYYNPLEGSRMSTSTSRRNSRASRSSDDLDKSLDKDNLNNTLEVVKERLQEEIIDDPSEKTLSEKEEDIDEKMPVPQVKVGPNGEIIIDEESTIIETTAAKKAKEDLLKSPLIFENANNQGANYGTWGKKRKNSDWSHRETVRFFKALCVFGTDFSMMTTSFKKRSRQELKLKFKKEERQNRTLVDRCLREGMQFDNSIFHSDSEDEIEDEKREIKKRRKTPQKNKKPNEKVRKTKSSRAYYSSSDADESANTSDIPANDELLT